MSRQRSIPSCLHGANEGLTSTRQIKKGCQHKDLHITSCLHGTEEGQKSTRWIKKEGQKSTRQIKKVCQDNTQNYLHGKDESKTKYSASQITLITWTTHPKNKQGIQAEKTSTKKSSFKRKYNVILRGTSIKVNYIKRHHQEKR